MKSTTKPIKPYPDFPLTPHAKGWCKKYNGKVRMVCGLIPADKALLLLADKLKAWDAADGITAAPPPLATDDFPVVDLADLFLDSKEAQIAEGMERRTYDEYEEAVRNFVETVGPRKLVSHLAPADFQQHRLALASRMGVHRQKKFMILVRSMFKWGVTNGHTIRLPRYGTEYKLPPRRAFRIAEAEREQTNGKLRFTADEVSKLLTACGTASLRAMILLAVNGGYGQEDLASMPLSVLTLESGLVDYHRGKTGVHRRMFLWPETVKAVRAAMKERPKASAPEFGGLLFLTKWGNPYVRDVETENENGETRNQHKDQVGMQFYHLCKRADVYKPGRNFYSLRRTFRTLADECHDQRATAHIMGHDTGDVAALYVEHIDDARLRKITDYVRSKILPGAKPEKGKATRKGANQGKAGAKRKGRKAA